LPFSSPSFLKLYLSPNAGFQPPGKWLGTENKRGLFPVGWKFLLAFTSYYSFVFVMGSDPNPNEVITVFDSKCSMTHAGSYRPKRADFLEMKG
jgi:hypothetical protein